MEETCETTKVGDFTLTKKVTEWYSLGRRQYNPSKYPYLDKAKIHNDVCEILDKYRHIKHAYSVSIFFADKSIVLHVEPTAIELRFGYRVEEHWEHGAFPLIYDEVASKVVKSLFGE